MCLHFLRTFSLYVPYVPLFFKSIMYLHFLRPLRAIIVLRPIRAFIFLGVLRGFTVLSVSNFWRAFTFFDKMRNNPEHRYFS